MSEIVVLILVCGLLVVCIGAVSLAAWCVNRVIDGRKRESEATKELLMQWAGHSFALKAPGVAQAELETRRAELVFQEQKLNYLRDRGKALREAHGKETGDALLSREAQMVGASDELTE